MSDVPHDYSADLEAPSSDGLAKLSSLANDLYLAEMEVVQKKRELEEAQLHADDIAQRQIPQLMETLGIGEFTTTSGVKLSIQDVLRVGPAKARREEAYKWLSDNDYGDLVKRNVIVGFGRGEEQDAFDLAADLERQGLRTKDEVKVESQTLKKWVKDRLAAGEAVDMELFGVRQFKQAKITARPETAFGD